MAVLGTICNECRFFNNGNCDVGKIKVFKEAGAKVEKNVNGDTTINRVCPFRRLEDWYPDLSLSEQKSKLKQEVYVNGTVCVIMKDDNKEELIKTLNEISKIDNIQNFRLIVSFHKSNVFDDIIKILHECVNYTTDYMCVKIIEDVDSLYMDEAFRKSKNGFIFFIETGKQVDEKIVDKINFIINEQLLKICYFYEDKHTVHNTACMSIIYSYLRGHKFINVYEKITQLTNYQDLKNMTMSMEELNARYESSM